MWLKFSIHPRVKETTGLGTWFKWKSNPGSWSEKKQVQRQQSVRAMVSNSPVKKDEDYGKKRWCSQFKNYGI